MLRTIGILTGAALAVAFLIVALGVPGFTEPDVALEPEDQVRVAAPPVAVPEPEVEALAEHEPESTPEPLPEPVAETTPEPERQSESGSVPVAKAAPEPDYEALVDQIFSPDPGPIEDENWYAFWSPFRSELAANGFVSKLQETTGIDYRVVKVKTGVYEVAFAYLDDEDIQEKLARISAATGLDMSDS